MLKNILFSLKKSNILSKITIEYQKKLDIKSLISNTVSGNKSQKEILLQKLFDLLSKDKHTVELLKKHNCDFPDLKKIIEVLELNGAGQIVKGHYVPISAISFLDTLNILLTYWDKENFKVDEYDTYNSNLAITNKMLNSF